MKLRMRKRISLMKLKMRKRKSIFIKGSFIGWGNGPTYRWLKLKSDPYYNLKLVSAGKINFKKNKEVFFLLIPYKQILFSILNFIRTSSISLKISYEQVLFSISNFIRTDSIPSN